jgi:Asp-tRNA(Asn)/Glu-tRNA(Gln) amidotransferase A subunit family amidase
MAARFVRREFLGSIGALVGAGVLSDVSHAREAWGPQDGPQSARGQTGLETLTEWIAANAESRSAGMQSCLARIQSTDSSVAAWVQVLPQEQTGKGMLTGIPYGAKDIIETRGMATEYGSPIYKGRIGTVDAAIVRDLRKTGAILLGKTQTAAFAFRDPPPTRNPRNVGHTPGGSSSGSAAAVAAGMVPFALGTQTTGSTIRPASYCGVTGFKPTYGLLSVEGILPYAKSLDTVGLFTHTPSDMLLLWRALGRSVGREQNLTIGVPEPMPEVEPEMTIAFQEALAALHKAGISCQAVNISEMLVQLAGAQRTIAYYEGARFHQQRLAEYGDRLGQLATLVREGLQIPISRYQDARGVVAKNRERITGMYRTTPIIAVPAATGPAPTGISYTGDARMNSPWSALGTPALSIPIPVGNSLPLGLQLTSSLGDDARLLQTAVRVHRVLLDG